MKKVCLLLAATNPLTWVAAALFVTAVALAVVVAAAAAAALAMALLLRWLWDELTARPAATPRAPAAAPAPAPEPTPAAEPAAEPAVVPAAAQGVAPTCDRAQPDEGPTNEELIRLLRERGVRANARWKRETLLGRLAAE